MTTAQRDERPDPASPAQETQAPSPGAELRALLPFRASPAPMEPSPPSTVGLPFKAAPPPPAEGALVALPDAGALAIPKSEDQPPREAPDLLGAMNQAASATPLQQDAAPVSARAARTTRASGQDSVVRLLWFDPEAVARIRAYAEAASLLDVEPEPPPPEVRTPASRAQLAPDERDVLGILARVRSGVPSLTKIVGAALGEHGELVPPLLALAGEMEVRFDGRARVRAMVAAAALLLASDREASASLAALRGLLDDPALEGADGVAEALKTHVHSLVAQSKRAPAAAFLDAEVERALLAQRRYEKLSHLGKKWLRAHVHCERDAAPLLAYLPEALAPLLPLSRRFSARLIAEVDLCPDPAEPQRLALRVLSLGRVVRRAELFA
jgi:hypothetical protein